MRAVPHMPQSTQRGHADLAVINGKIATLDTNDQIVSALAVSDGRILAVGTDDEIERLCGPQTRRIDAAQRLALAVVVHQALHLDGKLVRSNRRRAHPRGTLSSAISRNSSGRTSKEMRNNSRALASLALRAMLAEAARKPSDRRAAPTR